MKGNTLDYSLTGENANRAVELGLAEADWYQSPVPREMMRQLLKRKDGPALLDTLLLVTILVSLAIVTVYFWGTWWALISYLLYAVFYGTSSDSRWHECSHGTAFKTDWMNNVVYEIASFMVMRESVVWRWSHNRHHSDTIIVGRDPEIQIPRPPNIKGLVLSLVNLGGYLSYYPSLFRHALGKISSAERTFIPEMDFNKIYRNARICIIIYTLIIISAVIFKSWIPIFLFILPQFFGTWLMIIHNTTQHAGLAENVLDHRLNCRTVYMNPISRFIYWNMNYHLEHHMFPLVPYHALPKLHQLVKSDCPPVYKSIYSAWSEIVPAIFKQVKEPSYYIKRKLPNANKAILDNVLQSTVAPDADGWVAICSSIQLENENVLRFDHNKNTFAIYRDNHSKLYATDGICTHGNTHLSEGLVKGKTVECPKHNGRFNLQDGSPARSPICRSLATYPIEERNGQIWLNIKKNYSEFIPSEKNYNLKVVRNLNVSTFIKELVLEPLDKTDKIVFTAGDYFQIDIPMYSTISYKEFDIQEPYATTWEHQGLFKLTASNAESVRRNNYSLASNSLTEYNLKFNVRIATPPPGQDCPAGIGSSYLFNLKSGDTVCASGSFGDFHIKPTSKEMVYIGGGAGMAPIRAHIAQLFENESTARKVSYWYGARSKQEIFYEDYFKSIENEHKNFNFEIALSNPLQEDNWTGHNGFIHNVVFENYLKNHTNLKAVEFYLCGPPLMIKACLNLLVELGVSQRQIAFDEF
jgi:Na(+)-translocating NADH:ubiquinone oxidoreductase F subunit